MLATNNCPASTTQTYVVLSSDVKDNTVQINGETYTLTPCIKHINEDNDDIRNTNLKDTPIHTIKPSAKPLNTPS